MGRHLVSAWGGKTFFQMMEVLKCVARLVEAAWKAADTGVKGRRAGGA